MNTEWHTQNAAADTQTLAKSSRPLYQPRIAKAKGQDLPLCVFLHEGSQTSDCKTKHTAMGSLFTQRYNMFFNMRGEKVKFDDPVWPLQLSHGVTVRFSKGHRQTTTLFFYNKKTL